MHEMPTIMIKKMIKQILSIWLTIINIPDNID
jgi:hypothetical protein